ncbi:MAG TPA: sulfotransferase [Thermoanaerobaculia bacterium]|nr:sulfotransferase [Thermoanaerobaculia bacterium]
MQSDTVCRKLFVVGCPRSGTTWIHDIFRQHPQAATSLEASLFDFLREPWWRLTQAPLSRPRPGEQGVSRVVADLLEKLLVRDRSPWFPEWRAVLIDYFENRAVFALNHSRVLPWRTVQSRLRSRLVGYNRLRKLIAETEAAEPSATHDQKVARVARRVLDDHYARRRKATTDILIEKSPSHLFHAGFILDHLPEARVIEVVRDGRDVCVSMDAYRRWMPRNRKFQAWLWKTYVEEGFRLQREERFQGRLLRVRYEDLHSDRPSGIAALLKFAGLEASRERVKSIAEATHISRIKDAGEGKHYRKGVVGDWKDRLKPEDLSLFRETVGDLLERLGYAVAV